MSDTKFVPPSNQNFLALPIGTVIGRYRVTGVLGQGSFGITYCAHDGQLGRDVAIKEYLPTSFAFRHDGLTVLPNSTAAAEDFAWGRQRFVEEGRTLAGFRRAPGIVRVHDFLEANGTAYIVMELATGETLGARLQRQKRLTATEVERILSALLEGLERVHAASFIHRDIKPDNILLDEEGHPTLIDFGAARAAVANRTAALTGVFTPGYAAAEQFTDGRQGPFTDIYALSATLYQSIAGEKAPSAIDRAFEDKCIPLAKRQPAGFAPALLTGIDRGMAVRPEARPQTIAAWRALLFPAEVRERPIPAPAAKESTRWRLAAIAGFAAALVAGAAAGALFLLAPQNAPVIDADRQQAERSTAAAAAATAAKRQAEEETQRRATAAAAEKQRAEEETQRQAATAAAAVEKQRVEDEAQRQAATAAAAVEKRRAEEETQRRAAAEQARRRQVEADARQQAIAEEAQRKADEDARVAAAAKRQAAEAEEREAARQLAEQEARGKAAAVDVARSAEAAEKAKTEAAAALGRKAAEAAEAALRLGPVDRQRIQLALTTQGFDTRGTDGVLGPHSREMIAAWQTARGLPVTGFVDAAQRQRLISDSAAAVAKFDAEQKKAADEEARRREQARPDPTTAAASPSRPVPDTGSPAFAGRWSLVRSKCIPSTPQRFFGVTVEGNSFSYGFAFASRTASCSVAIRPDGSFANNACEAPMSGQVSGNRMTLSQRHPEIICDFEFQKQ